MNTREELREYDPAVADLCEEIFGDAEWRYVHPIHRNDEDHLRRLNRSQLPQFRWAPGMQEAYEAHPRSE